MAESNQVVTRFAPSPTGYLHIGGARTALFNWAFARRHGGQFILRIEDTDRARSTPEATRRIIEDLQWLGLDWDQGPDPAAKDLYAASTQMGDREPYFQSQRGELYRQYLQQLIDAGRAYPENGAYRFKMPEKDITVPDAVLGDVTIKREQLEDFIIFKGEAAGGGPTFHFANVVDDATMGVTHVLRAQEHLMNTPKHVALFEALGLEHPRYAHMPLIFNPDGTKMSKRDKAKAARKAGQDYVAKHGFDALLAKVDLHGLHVPDDGNVKAITRDRIAEFLAKKNDDLDIVERLAFALRLQLPEIDVHDFKMSGYLQPALLNYIALLGWSPKGDVEMLLEANDPLGYGFYAELIKRFDISGIGKTNARFDRAKLLAFNARAIEWLTDDQFQQLLFKHMEESVRIDRKALSLERVTADSETFALFAKAYRPRAKTLSDPFVLGRFFMLPDDSDELTPDEKTKQKYLWAQDAQGWRLLQNLVRDLDAVAGENWAPEYLQQLIEQFAQKHGVGMGDVAQPLRVALSGTPVSPAIQDTLAILGKGSSIARVWRCINRHRPPQVSTTT